MNIYIYDGFRLLDTIDTWESLRWRRRYNGCGEFELHVETNADYLKLFKDVGKLHGDLHISRTDRPETGVVEKVILSNSGIEVYGRFLESWLDGGIIEEIYEANESYADSVRTWVEKYIVPEHSGLVLGNTIEAEKRRFQTSYRNILQNTEKLARAGGFGFYIEKDLDAKAYRFHLYRGRDRTPEQNENGRVFFTTRFQNLEEPVYEYDKSPYRNYALVMGEGEGIARERVVVDRRDPGEVKRALYVNAAQQSMTDGMTLEEYRALLADRGAAALDAAAAQENFTGNALETPNFIYMIDYDLGDIVTVENEDWGKGSFQRISEVEEIYEGAAEQIIPVFGEPLPENLDLEELA